MFHCMGLLFETQESLAEDVGEFRPESVERVCGGSGETLRRSSVKFHYFGAGGQQASMSDVHGQAVIIEEVCPYYRHEDIGHHEVPDVSFGAVVQGELLVPVSVDRGPVGGLHCIEGFPLMPSHAASWNEGASSASIDEELELGFWIFEGERRI